MQSRCPADVEHPCVLVPRPWEGKPLPAPSGVLKVPLDMESTEDGEERASWRAWDWYQSQVCGLISHSRQLQDGASFPWRGEALSRGAGSHHGTASSGRGRGQDFVFNLLLVYLSL